jgi:hypothetical protein
MPDLQKSHTQSAGSDRQPAQPAPAEMLGDASMSATTTPPIVPLLLADASFRAELEDLVWEARQAEAVFVCHDAAVVGAWERLADRLDLVQRAYVLWKVRARNSGHQLGER